MSASMSNIVEEATKKFYRRRLVTTIIAFVIAFAIGSENAVIFPTAWKYLQMLGSRDETDLGILISAFNVAALISSVFFGWLVDRRMHLSKPVVFIGALTQIAGSVMYFLGINKWLIISGRFICGFGSGTLIVVLAELARATSNEERAKFFTLGFSMQQLGVILGPAYNLALHDVDTQFGDVQVNEESLPGFIFAIFWSLASVVILAAYENVGEQYIALQKLIAAAKDSEIVRYGTFLHLPNGDARDFAENSTPNSTMNRKDSDSKAKFLHSVHSSTPSQKNAWNEIPPHHRPEDSEERNSTFMDLLIDTIVVILFMQTTVFFCLSLVETIIPPIMQTYYGLGTRANSFLFLLVGGEAMISYAFVIVMRNRLLDRTLILLGNLLVVIALISLMITTRFQESHPDQVFPFFIVSCSLVFLGVPMSSVFSLTLGSKLVRPNCQGKMQALRRVANSVGLILGPLWAGALNDADTLTTPCEHIPYYTADTFVGQMAAQARVRRLIHLATGRVAFRPLPWKQEPSLLPFSSTILVLAPRLPSLSARPPTSLALPPRSTSYLSCPPSPLDLLPLLPSLPARPPTSLALPPRWTSFLVLN
ncbi:unnamed protein product [Darwinula stevensoni]|uniref:Major facilitator superfamily (MFS) profile domain-containing protein n=1 Tax=Darwinula stevensoni TaxID=69355 RepID=A0A7R9AGP6_9CRUS|nr:unnamed protein product [Darwinula stevensoni]CAG0904222.1 unnamed protein product [Darwinula stevensoni]